MTDAGWAIDRLFELLQAEKSTITICLKCIDTHKWNFRDYVYALPTKYSVCVSCLNVGVRCCVVPAKRARAYLHPFHSSLIRRENDDFDHMWSMLKIVLPKHSIDEYKKLWDEARTIALAQAAHVEAAISQALQGGT